MATLAGIYYEELVESFSGSIGLGNTNVTRKYKVAWEDFGDFLIALRGGWTTQDEQTWSFAAAHRMTGIYSNFYCHQVDFEPIGSPHDWAPTGPSSSDDFWTHMIVTAQYKIPKTDPTIGNPADVMTENIRMDADSIILPEGAFKKKGSSDPGDIIMLPTKKIIPVMDYELTLYNRPRLPLGTAANMGSKYGMVNSVEFKGADKHTMMFMGGDTSRAFIAPNSPLGWTIREHFRFRPIPWDWLFSPKYGKFIEVEPNVSGGDPLIAEYDLNLLLNTSNNVGQFQLA